VTSYELLLRHIVFIEDSVVRFRQFKLVAFEFTMHVDIEA
jgi:hypothetical protein